MDWPGEVTIWLAPSKRSLHVSLAKFKTFSDGDFKELKELAGTQHVYYGHGLRTPGLTEAQQGGKQHICYKPTLVLDVDFLNPAAHKAQNLPVDLEEASVLFEGLPDPSAIIDTGNGVHVYWFLVEPLILDSATKRNQAQKIFRDFQAPYIRRAKERGWHLDNTASIQRVWRLPGFINQKTNRPVKTLLMHPHVRWELGDFGLSIPKARAATDSPPKPKAAKAPTAAKPSQSSPPLLDEMRERLRRVSPNNEYHDAITLLLNGESFAEPGNREKTIQGIASTMAWMPEGRDADPDVLAEIFRASFEAWQEEPVGEGEKEPLTVDEELEKAVDRIARSQEDWHYQEQERRPQLESIARGLGIKLEESDESNSYFLQHSIIQRRKNYYSFDFRDGAYGMFKEPGEVLTYVRDAWEESPDDLSLTYLSKGVTKYKQLPQVLREYATNADELVGDMTIDESWFDPKKRVFHEAMARKRIVEAEYDPRIDTWLKKLCGSSYEKVCDWLAVVPHLQHQLCALYFDGASGAGKGLFANGLARLWIEGAPTPLNNILTDFTEDIMKCPLLFIDEGLPQRKGNVSTEIRALVGASSFRLTEKYSSSRIVRGAIRLIIAANNANVLCLGDDEMSANDLEAIVGRFLHVRARRESAEWIDENNAGGHMTQEWVEGDGIAKHCLHLSQTRKVDPGKRFMVEGDETEMHRKVVMQGEINGLIYEWLVRFATSPNQVYERYRSKSESSRAQIGDDRILVNTQCVIDCWDSYMPKDARRPSTSRTGSVLTKVSDRVIKIGKRGSQIRYHVVKPGMVLDWCKQHQIGDEGHIATNLKTELGASTEEILDDMESN